MARRMDDPRLIFPVYTDECRELFGTRLESVVLHGSVARGEYDPKYSDINFFIVVQEDGLDRLGSAVDFVARWRKRGVSTPVVLTGEFLRGAFDSFPIEFLNMKSAYEVLYGRDPLQGITIDRGAVRAQTESEARADLLRLRRCYLESARARDLRGVVSASLPGYYATFRAVSWLLTGERVQTQAETLDRACGSFGLDRALFDDLEAIRRGAKPDESTMRDLFERYLREARKLVLGIDKLDSILEEDLK